MIEQPVLATIGITMMTAAVIWMAVHHFRDRDDADEPDAAEELDDIEEPDDSEVLDDADEPDDADESNDVEELDGSDESNGADEEGA
jgi:hypothetical protein